MDLTERYGITLAIALEELYESDGWLGWRLFRLPADALRRAPFPCDLEFRWTDEDSPRCSFMVRSAFKCVPNPCGAEILAQRGAQRADGTV